MIQLENNARAIYKIINPNAFYDDEFTCIQSGIVYRKKPEISQYVSLFPNPSTGKIILSYSIEKDATLVITDEIGRIILNTSVEASSTSKLIDISRFTNGIYFYKICNDTFILGTGKIVLTK